MAEIAIVTSGFILMVLIIRITSVLKTRRICESVDKSLDMFEKYITLKKR